MATPSRLLNNLMNKREIDLSQAPSVSQLSFNQQSSHNDVSWVQPLKNVSNTLSQSMTELNQAYVSLLKDVSETYNDRINSLVEQQSVKNELYETTIDSLIRVIGAATTGEEIDKDSINSLQKFLLRNTPQSTTENTND